MAKKRLFRKKQRLEEKRIEEATRTINIKKTVEEGKRAEKIRQAGRSEEPETEETREEQPEKKEEQQEKEREGREDREEKEDQGEKKDRGENEEEGKKLEGTEESQAVPEGEEAADIGEGALEEGGEEAADAGETAAAEAGGGEAGAAAGGGAGATAGGGAGAVAGGGAGATAGGGAGAIAAAPTGETAAPVTVPAGAAAGGEAGAAAGGEAGAAAGGEAGAAAGGEAGAAAGGAAEAGKKAAKESAKAGAIAARQGTKQGTKKKGSKNNSLQNILMWLIVVITAFSLLITGLFIAGGVWVGYTVLGPLGLAGQIISGESGSTVPWSIVYAANPYTWPLAASSLAARLSYQGIKRYFHRGGVKQIKKDYQAVKAAANAALAAIKCSNGACQSSGSYNDSKGGVAGAKTADLPRKDQLATKDELSQLITNFNALAEIDKNGDQILKLAVKNLQLTKSIRQRMAKQKNFKNRDELLKNLSIIETHNSVILDSVAAISFSPNREPLLKISRSDTENLMAGKIDRQTINLAGHLASESRNRLNLPIYQLSSKEIGRILDQPPAQQKRELAQALKINPEWSQIGISNLEKKKLKITSAGNYAITKDSQEYWRPAKIEYQNKFHPADLLLYRPPRNNLELSADLVNQKYPLLFQISPRIYNLDQLALRSGIKKVGLEIGIEDEYLNQARLTKDSIGSALIESQLGLAPGSIRLAIQNDWPSEEALGQGYWENWLKLPTGSLAGTDSDQILQSIGVGYLKEQFGLTNTSWDGSWQDKDLGLAIIEEFYGTRDQKIAKELIEESLAQAQRRLGLSQFPGPEQLAQVIGQNFKRKINFLNKQTLAELAKNPQQTEIGLGGLALAKTMGLDAYSGPEQLENQITDQDLAAVLGLANSERTIALAKTGQLIINNLDKNALTELNIKKACFQNSACLSRAASRLGEEKLKKLFIDDQPIISGYQTEAVDWQDIEAGKWVKSAYRIGAATLDAQLSLPQNSFGLLLTSQNRPKESLAQVGLALAKEELGANRNLAMERTQDLTPVLTDHIGQLLVESQGLAPGSFKYGIDRVIEENGEARIASAFNLTERELQSLRKGRVGSRARQSLKGIDRSLRLPLGTSASLLKKGGEKSTAQYGHLVGQAAINNSSYKILGDPNSNRDAREDYLSELAGETIGQKLGWASNSNNESTNNAVLANLENPLGGASAILERGLSRIASLPNSSSLADNNINQFFKTNIQREIPKLNLSSAEKKRLRKFKGLYRRFNTNSPQVAAAQTDQPSITVFSSSSCSHCLEAKNYLKNKGVGFQEISIDSRTGLQALKEKAGRLLVPTIVVKAGPKEEVVAGFDPAAIDRALKKLYYQKEATTNEESPGQEKMSQELKTELEKKDYRLSRGEIEEILWAYYWDTRSGRSKPSPAFWVFLASKFDLGQSINQKVGVPFFAEGILIWQTSGDWWPLAVSIAADLFHLGEANDSQDPSTTARLHGRELVGWALGNGSLPQRIGLPSKDDAEKLSGCVPNTESGLKHRNAIEFQY